MKNKVYIGGGVGGKIIPALSTTNLNIKREIKLKIFCLKCLDNSVYRNIFYMCFNRGFVYKKELEKLLYNKITNQIELLIQYGIIEETSISREFVDFLYSQNGFNYHNVQKIKLYSFSKFGTQIYSKYKDFINLEANKRVIEYLEKEQNSKKQIELRKLTRYKIIKQKNPHLRTIEDNLLIQEVEKILYKNEKIN